MFHIFGSIPAFGGKGKIVEQTSLLEAMSSSSASGSVAPVATGIAAPRSPRSPPKRARGSVGAVQSAGEEVKEVTALVTSHLFQRLTQLEVRVTESGAAQKAALQRLWEAERTVRRQGSEIQVLQEEVFTLKSRVIMAEARLPVAEDVAGPMTDADDAAALRPALTQQELADLLDDTASEPDERPVEDHWAYRAHDL